MRPPRVRSQRDRFAAEFDCPMHASRLIEARNILHDPAAALAKIMRLFMRIHRADPFEIEPDTRRIIADAHPEAAQAFDRLDRQRTDLDLVDPWPQRPRRAKIVLLALMPDRREAVLD